MDRFALSIHCVYYDRYIDDREVHLGIGMILAPVLQLLETKHFVFSELGLSLRVSKR
jgi:hypothetical protein